MRIIYSRGTNNRKEKFAIMTQIIEDKGKHHVLKIALNPESEKHISQIANDHARLKLPKPYYAPEAKIISDSTIMLPFVAGENLEKEFYVSLRKRDSQKVIELFNLVENLILSKTTKTKATDQSNYKSVFGNAFNKDTVCSDIGLIDYNFDNFIKVKNQIFLVDYEWYFGNLKIPVDYLMSRLIYNTFAVKFKDTVKNLPTAEDPIIRVFDDYFVPEYIFKEYRRYLDATHEMLKTERCLQNYILVTQNNKDLPAIEYSYERIDLQRPPEVEIMHLEKIGAEASRDELILKSSKQEERIASLLDENQILLNKIERLRKLPLVKTALKARRKLVRKSE